MSIRKKGGQNEKIHTDDNFIYMYYSSYRYRDKCSTHKGKGGDAIQNNALRMLEEGKHTFRFDTFGDEAFWGDTLKLHQAIAGSKLGGVGDGVSPKTALAVGLKVDMDALPKDLVRI